MSQCLTEIGITAERVEELFAAVDVDRSGFIEYKEFAKVVFHAKKMTSTAKAQEQQRDSSHNSHGGLGLGSQPPIT